MGEYYNICIGCSLYLYGLHCDRLGKSDCLRSHYNTCVNCANVSYCGNLCMKLKVPLFYLGRAENCIFFESKFKEV